MLYCDLFMCEPSPMHARPRSGITVTTRHEKPPYCRGNNHGVQAPCWCVRVLPVTQDACTHAPCIIVVMPYFLVFHKFKTLASVPKINLVISPCSPAAILSLPPVWQSGDSTSMNHVTIFVIVLTCSTALLVL